MGYPMFTEDQNMNNNNSQPYQPVYVNQSPDGSYSVAGGAGGGYTAGYTTYTTNTTGYTTMIGSNGIAYIIADPGHSHSVWGGGGGSAGYSSYSYCPSISLYRIAGGHSLEKVEDKVWRIANLTFDIIISLQEAGISYTWKKDNNNIYMCFESEAEEAQAIIVLTEFDEQK